MTGKPSKTTCQLSSGMGCKLYPGIGCKLCPEWGVNFGPEYAPIEYNDCRLVQRMPGSGCKQVWKT
jgi:hypothetical protein